MWMNKNARSDIRQEFIDKAMRGNTDVHSIKLSKRFISWLLRHYYTHQLVFHFYDMETTWDNSRQATWDERMSTCIWQDLFENGCWCDTQREVDQRAKNSLNDFRKAGHLKNRVWCGIYKSNDGSDYMHIYLYGRDIHEYDAHFLMKRRKSYE